MKTHALNGLSPRELRAIVLSHGWFDLAPWIADAGDRPGAQVRIARAFDGPDGVGAFEIASERGRVVCRVLEGGAAALEAALRCMSLDLEVGALHRIAEHEPMFAWLAEMKLGRYLRSPTLFEDAYKVLCTTNVNWAGTSKMVERTIRALGREVAGHRTFPPPQALLRLREAELKETIGCGYRARGLLHLAKRALEAPDLYLGTGWRAMDAESFAAEVGSINGIGPASVSYLGRFYGKPLGFTVDSWVAMRCREMFRPRGDIARFAKRRYRAFGEWAPSVFWFEITRHWHEPDAATEDGSRW